MTVKRILAIVIIFMIACAGWTALGAVTAFRSQSAFYHLGSQVYDLWGEPLTQVAPTFNVKIPGSENVRWIMPSRNEIQVEIIPDYRKKGLIWHPTYICRFQGRYTLTNDETAMQKIRLHFDFPASGATYDDFGVFIDNQPLSVSMDTEKGVGCLLELSPGQSKTFFIRYKTRGMRDWRYQPDQNTGRVKNLTLTADIGFDNPDYSMGSLSPMEIKSVQNGMRLIWRANDLITQANMGIVVPEKMNPGPLTTRITYFAPVCLIFFFVLITAIGIVQKIPIHPMHYLFAASGFFAFHLLLAYLVDHIHIHIAFALSALVSVGLVTLYLHAALNKKLAWKTAAAGQLFYLVLFSYSFFLEGATGLTVAIGSVATLAVLMKVTAATNWENVFMRRPSPRRPIASGARPSGI